MYSYSNVTKVNQSIEVSLLFKSYMNKNI